MADAQYIPKLVSSFLLAVDNKLLSNNLYTNHSGLFYRASGSLYNMNVYSSPYRQFVNDASITGAIIPSGLWVNGQFITPNLSGLISYNISEGQAYFSNAPASVSGTYSVKDVNVYLTTEPEEKILFESKFYLKPKFTETLAGLPQELQTCPAVFIKVANSVNIPFCLGGAINKDVRIRATVMAESEYQMYSICNILEDMASKHFSIIEPTSLPFDALGGYTGVAYNYTGLCVGATLNGYIQEAKSSFLLNTIEFNHLNPKIYPAFVDFTVWNFLA